MLNICLSFICCVYIEDIFTALVAGRGGGGPKLDLYFWLLPLILRGGIWKIPLSNLLYRGGLFLRLGSAVLV